MKQYWKISYPTDTSGLFADGSVFIQEKVDGSCGRFTLEKNIEKKYHTTDRDLVFGSRNVEYKNKKDENTQFSKCIEYIRESVNINILRGYDEKYGGIILFGEFMVPNIIKEGYNWDKWKHKFIGFDVWSIQNERFLHPETVTEIFDSIGLPYTQILDTYSVTEWKAGNTNYHDSNGNWLTDDKWCPDTQFGDGKAEGIILKNPTTKTYAKMVREDFREKHQTGDMDQTEEDAVTLSYKYITDARIEKTITKLINEGQYEEASMKMMQDLPKEVIKDMAEEEGENIFLYEDWDIDLSKFRSITSDRCSDVLQRFKNT